MKNLARSTRMAVVPAVFAALALSACQDEAPSAAPPTPASPTAEASQGDDAQPEATQSPEAPTEESTQAPETSQAPPSDDGGSGASSGGCDATSSTFSFTKGNLQPKAQTAPQTASYRSNDGKAEVSFGKPKVDTSGGDSYFPGPGKKVVIYPVTIEMKSGSYYITSRLQLGLVDENDQPCKQDSGSYVLDRSEVMPVESLKQPGDKISKKMAFAIPADADLSKYSLVYASDYSSGKAELAWKGK